MISLWKCDFIRNIPHTHSSMARRKTLQVELIIGIFRKSICLFGGHAIHSTPVPDPVSFALPAQPIPHSLDGSRACGARRGSVEFDHPKPGRQTQKKCLLPERAHHAIDQASFALSDSRRGGRPEGIPINRGLLSKYIWHWQRATTRLYITYTRSNTHKYIVQDSTSGRFIFLVHSFDFDAPECGE